MRIAKLLVAAVTSAALVATPAVAQSQAASRSGELSALGARAAAAVDAENELFRKRGNRKRRGGGGVIVIIVVALIIALGVYIVVDKDDNEAPASP